jgi:hypothetical protein
MRPRTKFQERTRSISFPPKDIIFEPNEDEGIKTRFNDILGREHWSFSHGVWMAVVEYVERHGPGNPAQTLIRFMDGKQMYRAPKGHCQIRGCPGLAVGIVIHGKTGSKRQFCKNHLADSLKAGWVKDE